MNIESIYNRIIKIDGVLPHGFFKCSPSDIDIFSPQSSIDEVRKVLIEGKFTFSIDRPDKIVALKYEGAKLYIFDVFSSFNDYFYNNSRYNLTANGVKYLSLNPDFSRRLKYCFKNNSFSKEVSDFLENEKYIYLMGSKLLVTAIRNGNYYFRRVTSRFDFIKQHFSKGRSFSFLGPDGSGKSYIIDLIKPASPCKTIYLGDWFFFLQSFYNLLLKIPTPYNRFVYLFYYIENTMRRIAVAVFCLLGLNVLIDRFPGTNRASIHETGIVSKLNRLIYKFTPKPDLFFLLMARPEVVYERKQELSVREIERYQIAIKNITKNDNFIILNTEDLESTLNVILKELYRR